MSLQITHEEPVLKGRRVQGHLCTLDDGTVIYLAKRRHGDIHRAGHGSISGAMTEGEASWAFDEISLFNMRARKIALIGVRTTDTKDVYVTELANFFDLKKARIKDPEPGFRWGGTRRRLLPLTHFTCRRGEVELPMDKILAA